MTNNGNSRYLGTGWILWGKVKQENDSLRSENTLNQHPGEKSIPVLLSPSKTGLEMTIDSLGKAGPFGPGKKVQLIFASYSQVVCEVAVE